MPVQIRRRSRRGTVSEIHLRSCARFPSVRSDGHGLEADERPRPSSRKMCTNYQLTQPTDACARSQTAIVGVCRYSRTPSKPDLRPRSFASNRTSSVVSAPRPRRSGPSPEPLLCTKLMIGQYLCFYTLKIFVCTDGILLLEAKDFRYGLAEKRRDGDV